MIKMRVFKKWKNFDMDKVKCQQCGAELEYPNVKEITEFVIEGDCEYNPFGDRQGEIELVFECPECKMINDFEFAIMFEKMRRIEEHD